MLELLLLPWTLFKYVFSLVLWVALFISIDYQCKKYDLYTKVWKFLKGIRLRRPDFFKKNQKKFSDGQDDYYNSL